MIPQIVWIIIAMMFVFADAMCIWVALRISGKDKEIISYSKAVGEEEREDLVQSGCLILLSFIFAAMLFTPTVIVVKEIISGEPILIVFPK